MWTGRARCRGGAYINNELIFVQGALSSNIDHLSDAVDSGNRHQVESTLSPMFETQKPFWKRGAIGDTISISSSNWFKCRLTSVSIVFPVFFSRDGTVVMTPPTIENGSRFLTYTHQDNKKEWNNDMHLTSSCGWRKKLNRHRVVWSHFHIKGFFHTFHLF